MATVNQWFIRRKALALSTLMTAFAVGGFIVVPLLAFGNAHIGWRDTLMYTGVFVSIITLPVVFIIRSKPEDMGLRPDGDGGEGLSASVPGHETTASQVDPQDFTVRQALRTHAFWFLLTGVMTRVSVTNAIVIFQIPILVWKGVDEQTAALYISLMFFLAIPLRFGLGVAGGHLSPRKLLLGGMSMGAIGLLAMLAMEGTAAVVIFILGMAVVEGVTSVNWIMVGDYFGRMRFASLMGVMSIFHNVGLVITPIFSGWVFDHTQSYTLVFLPFIPLYVLSGLSFAMARKPTLPQSTIPASVKSETGR